MKKYRIALIILLLIGAGIITVMYLSSHNIPVLEPKGLISVKEKKLIVTASLLMLIVVIPVFAFAIYFTWKFREGKNARHDPNWEHNYIAEFCWWGVPFLIIIVALLFNSIKDQIGRKTKSTMLIIYLFTIIVFQIKVLIQR